MHTQTENGALTLTTSGVALTDMFFRLGASRTRSEEDILSDFKAAMAEHPLLALKMLFYARDIRGGQGERRLFRICLNWLAQHHGSIVIANIPSIVEFGRWDDLFILLQHPGTREAALEAIRKGIEENNGLLFKWLPREKSAKRALAMQIARGLGMSAKDYRKMLAEKTKVVEQLMCANKWTNITYPAVPSRAMHIYRKAFQRHNTNGWQVYIDTLNKGESKVNSATLYPHEIIKAVQHTYDETQLDLAEHQWRSLPDFLTGNENIIPVCDVSGSMSGTPMDVSIGLGIYLAERNSGHFRNKFITFSSRPKLLEIDPNISLKHKINAAMQLAGYSTNIEATFDLILKAAVKAETPIAEMPSIILVLSDMEFDVCQANPFASGNSIPVTAFDMISNKYSNAGYTMPKLVFWNLRAASSENVPVRYNDQGVALVSGFSPSIMKAILAAKDFTPLSVMLEAITNKRYDAVTIA